MTENHKLAIVFDFGGVLMDWNPRYLYRKMFPSDEAIEKYLDEVNFSDWNFQQDLGRPFSQAVTQLCAQYPQYEMYIRAFDVRWIESVGGAIEETVKILDELRQRDYQLYGLSNWSAEKFSIVREQYPFFGWFKDIVLSGDLKMAKPEPVIFRAFLERVNRPAGDCLFIDDSEKNIAVAQSLGFKTIHFVSPDQLRGELMRSNLL